MNRVHRLVWLVVTAFAVAVATVGPAGSATAASRPVITSVTADTGSSTGIAHVIIRGSHLSGGTVLFGGRTTPARVLDSHTILAYPPGRRPGRVSVQVRTGAGRSTIAHYRFKTASRTARWSARQATVPSGGRPEDLVYSATDCPTSSTCVSVGTDVDPVARSIVRGHQTTVRVPLPADNANGVTTFDLISCPSARFCLAGGQYLPGDPTFAGLFATWNGTSWRSVRAPAPAAGDDDVYGQLLDLSCGAPASCTAISQGTIYTLARGSWTASAPRLPAGTRNARLADVSCASASSCVVTGTADAGDGTAPVVLSRSGGSWTSQRLPNPKGWPNKQFGPELLGLDCAAAGHCVIVAGAQRAPRYLIKLDNTRASYLRVPDPADGTADPFIGTNRQPITCPTVSACWTLDSYRVRRLSEEEGTVPAAVRLQGLSVRVYALPEPNPRRTVRSELNDLACPSDDYCVAVGSRRTNNGDPAYREAVYQTFASGVWTPSRAPVPAGTPAKRAYQLTGVACGAVRRCLADGTYRWDLRNGEDGPYFAQSRAVIAQSVPR